ncbi:MmgE/PrpD family protein [Aestuariicella hydrocarbonica]|uniref:MmgE/PrpD family protein n=1 Tax=Pseudomaricurvus hydrocarbonicus TaxID=1470433 RepID=A0A9E5T3J1_9GAMM|nr:MmgE/PrpD family protein [Aestuariicella hydrocarbonica]
MFSLTQQLVVLLRRPISPADRQRAAQHLLDWLGCSVLGVRSNAGEKFLSLLQSLATDGPCTVLAHDAVDWQSALWVNAAIGNIEEMDDVHRTSVLHPGPVVIPAAIAAAQRLAASPQQLLDSIVIGYEAMIRIGQSLGPDHYRFYHNTATCGSFGSAAAVASLLGLTDEQFVWALGNAGSRTGGLWQMRHEVVDSKQFHTVDAALTGSLVAYAAESGVRGPAAILEGPQGLFAATSPEAVGERVLAPEADWLMWQCSFKPWPACRHVHATIDACQRLVVRRPLSDIQRIEVRTYRDALVFCDRSQPQNTLQAKFSLQHAVAVCLLHGAPQLSHFNEGCFQDPIIDRLRGQVQVTECEAFQRAYPNHFGASVTLTFADGSSTSEEVSDAWGDPENPLSGEELTDKANTLMRAAGVPEAQRQQLINATLALPDANSLDPWLQQWPTSTGAFE